MVFGLMLLITVRGLAHFWPADVALIQVAGSEAGPVIGEFIDQEDIPASGPDAADDPDAELPQRFLIKTGNRDHLPLDFRWIDQAVITDVSYPSDIVIAEREEWGDFYGYLEGITEAGAPVVTDNVLAELGRRLERAEELRERIAHFETDLLGSINASLERLRIRESSLELKGQLDEAARAELAARRKELNAEYQSHAAELTGLNLEIARDQALMRRADGSKAAVPLARLRRIYQPNAMSWLDKAVHFAATGRNFIFDWPREANTEGGIYPAIFGTVLMVMIMSVFVTPFGVIAAIYLREYARQGLVTRLIRIAVNNLAGVPSVVYGVFGLGFFVYFIGGSIDSVFYQASLPSPTFGTPGLLWSSLTLALLTVPVVIVATEEGLSRVPRAMREGSLALGATKAETLWRTVLPMTTPAMITGLILAVARAAGEVAPLMMVGVVKHAPSLPLDGNAPFLHLDRKFMHLGFHIFDVGFQSPNVEAARPLVFATAFLLIVIIITLNIAAIRLRNSLREKYSVAET
ncbi:MAG: phosphate ABC transporter permease PstA [Gammaproteobacteria bacterium]|nr:phosphate ABC transporter permease PstA [Gammaproteobacteria bacterium]